MPGPWGALELTPIRLRVPEEMIPVEAIPIPPWVFEGRTLESVREQLLTAGIEPGAADALLATARDGQLYPTAPQLLALPGPARARLYEALRRLPANSHQLYPVRLPRDRLDRRLAELLPETRSLLERFLYERASLPGSWLLTDLPALTQLVSEPEQRRLVVQAVSQRDSALLRVHVGPETDVEALVSWWGRGGRRRDLETLLTSVQRVEGGYDLDALHLLPPLVRGLAFSYPHPGVAEQRDCFWTAVSFFDSAPRDAPLEEIRAALRRLRPVSAPPRLGDVMLLASQGELVHAAVYIAADVYFTKNGAHFSVPWLFMRRDDLLELYGELDPGGVVHYRAPELEP